MNYRHFFHAGNAADVFKHFVLLEILGALKAKETPFCAIDTHAGAGVYRLDPGGESAGGIGRIWPHREDWPDLKDYLGAVAQLNSASLHDYPGSPLLIANALRPQDRAVLVEWQPGEFAALARNLGQRRAVALHRADGLALLKALVPPRENRGVVLIDPPYERMQDFEDVADATRDALARWRNGVFVIWYPIKSRVQVDRMLASFRAMEIFGYAAEFLTLPEDMPQRLNGSGLVLINPPFRLDDRLRQVLPPLARALANPSGRPDFRLLNLGRESASPSC